MSLYCLIYWFIFKYYIQRRVQIFPIPIPPPPKVDNHYSGDKVGFVICMAEFVFQLQEDDVGSVSNCETDILFNTLPAFHLAQ